MVSVAALFNRYWHDAKNNASSFQSVRNAFLHIHPKGPEQFRVLLEEMVSEFSLTETDLFLAGDDLEIVRRVANYLIREDCLDEYDFRRCMQRMVVLYEHKQIAMIPSSCVEGRHDAETVLVKAQKSSHRQDTFVYDHKCKFQIIIWGDTHSYVKVWHNVLGILFPSTIALNACFSLGDIDQCLASTFFDKDQIVILRICEDPWVNKDMRNLIDVIYKRKPNCPIIFIDAQGNGTDHSKSDYLKDYPNSTLISEKGTLLKEVILKIVETIDQGRRSAS